MATVFYIAVATVLGTILVLKRPSMVAQWPAVTPNSLKRPPKKDLCGDGDS